MEEVKEILEVEERPEDVEIQTTFNNDTIEELNDGEVVIENTEEVDA